jgi:hypothetical protein
MPDLNCMEVREDIEQTLCSYKKDLIPVIKDTGLLKIPFPALRSFCKILIYYDRDNS